jgi:hypothetical protein
MKVHRKLNRMMILRTVAGFVLVGTWLLAAAEAFQQAPHSHSTERNKLPSSSLSQSAATVDSWFASDTRGTSTEAAATVLPLEKLKAQILQLGAALDRGQAYNPTSGDYYKGTMDVARGKIDALLSNYPTVPSSLEELEGEWELVLSSVPHGIFRSSPFFLAIQESYEYAEEKEMNGEPKANLFFRLHELQTCSWGKVDSTWKSA